MKLMIATFDWHPYCPHFQIVPDQNHSLKKLSRIRGCPHFIRTWSKKNCPGFQDFKMGTIFLMSDSDIRKSNVIMKHEWLRWHQMVQFFIFWWTISVSVFWPSCCKGWITIRNNLFEDFVRKLPRIRSSHECLMNQINKRF